MTAAFNRATFLRPIAHRGLHGGLTGPEENTEAAFHAAIAHEFGIECDLRPSADGDPFVFHDATLDRLTTATGSFAVCSSQELRVVRHRRSQSAIISFSDLLTLVNGHVPVLAELKSNWAEPHARFVTRVAELAADYRGPLAIMSFDPGMLVRLKAAAPAIPRGLVAMSGDALRWGSPAIDDHRAFALSNLLEAKDAEPAFIAYEIGSLPTPVTRYVREAQGLPLFAWTVRTADERAKAARHADAVIFEDTLDGLSRNPI